MNTETLNALKQVNSLIAQLKKAQGEETSGVECSQGFISTGGNFYLKVETTVPFQIYVSNPARSK